MNAETANQRSLFDLAVGVGARLGVSLRGHVTGGGSDANLTADLGVPSLDGLGVVGAEIHTRREWCFRRSLVSKALFSALLLDALSEEPSS
jgi:glutamate carboxypeptidase